MHTHRRFFDGETVWLPPIRYFDTPLPPVEECRVIGDQKPGGKNPHLYVYHSGYGHAVFIALPVFTTPARARAYSFHNAVLYRLVQSDEADALCEQLLQHVTSEEH